MGEGHRAFSARAPHHQQHGDSKITVISTKRRIPLLPRTPETLGCKPFDVAYQPMLAAASSETTTYVCSPLRQNEQNMCFEVWLTSRFLVWIDRPYPFPG